MFLYSHYWLNKQPKQTNITNNEEYLHNSNI